MKKLNELKEERTQLTLRYNEIMSQDMTAELRSEAKEIGTKITTIDGDIELAERAEELAKREVKNVEKVEERVDNDFQTFLRNAVEGKGPMSFRADPILTSTDADMINKTVVNGIDILTSPGEAFLRELGISFFPGLTGNFVVPSMAEDTAAFVAEDASGASANMTPDSLVLAARRVTHTQSITKETLAQTNPGIYAGIVQNLVNGIWNAITNDVFDTLETDAATQAYTPTAAGLTYGDIVGMEASIGGLNIGAGAYVTTPSGKAYLKQKVVLGTDNGPIWMDNQVNGYPAYGVPAANAGKVYFGDFSKCAVGQWGGVEIIVDPYSQAKQGRIVLTAVALADSGVTNKRGLVFADASMGL